ncbi:MAG: alpha/beta hydrolase [Oscillospiraceae bacterium]
MENQEFYLENDGCQIHCKLDYPASMQSPEDKCPLLILEHGLTGHMEEPHIVGIAAHMVSLGFAVMRVELYGHGKSSGEFRDHTVLKWVDQMLAVVDHAASLPFATDLYLAGHSQGGLTTMLVGALERDRLKAIMPLSPAILIRDAASEGKMLGCEFDPENIPETITMYNGNILGGNYLRVAQLLPIRESIRRYDKPVLIVHADTDELVPVQYAYDAAKLYQNCTLKIIKGDTHCYDRHLDEVCKAMQEFLETLQ